MSRHLLLQISMLAVIAGCATSLAARTAQAQTFPRWTGFASCKFTTTGPNNYYDEQTHRWEVIPIFPASQSRGVTYYSDLWTVQGGGNNSDGKWGIDGKGWGTIRFWVDVNNQLHIDRGNSQMDDLTGIAFYPNSGKPTYNGIFEQDFPISIRPSTNHVTGSSTPQFTGSIGLQEPAGSKTSVACSWDFTFGLVLITKLPGNLPRNR